MRQRLFSVTGLVVVAGLVGLSAEPVQAQQRRQNAPVIGRKADDGTPPSQRQTGAGATEAFGLSVRKGFSLSLALENVPGVRFIETDPAGRLFVSRPQQGDVLMFEDRDGDGVFEAKTTLAEGFPTAHGLCYHAGFLWFTQSGAIHKVRVDDLKPNAKPEVITVIKQGELPTGGGHWWRSILVDDDHLYTSIGDSGNISDETKTERQKVWRFKLDGSGKTLFASGLRNTEKLRHRPGMSEVWGVDHGSDWFGKDAGEGNDRLPITDYNPPCEFNKYVEGGFYGHPFVTGFKAPRYEYAFGKQKRDDIVELADKTIPPAWAFVAHSAANAFTFLDPARCGPGKGMPAEFAGDAFVAERGSWNRSELSGYAVVRVLFDNGLPYGALNVVSTLSEDGQSHNGKPIDCVQMPDGSVLFSVDSMKDGKARVFRIRHEQAK